MSTKVTQKSKSKTKMSENVTKMSQNYKYTVKVMLESLPHKEYKVARRKLPEFLGVNERTFARWINAKEGEKLEIPSDKLAVIAKYLNCPLEDMFNYKIPKFKVEKLAVDNEDVIKSLNFYKG